MAAALNKQSASQALATLEAKAMHIAGEYAGTLGDSATIAVRVIYSKVRREPRLWNPYVRRHREALRSYCPYTQRKDPERVAGAGAGKGLHAESSYHYRYGQAAPNVMARA